MRCFSESRLAEAPCCLDTIMNVRAMRIALKGCFRIVRLGIQGETAYEVCVALPFSGCRAEF